MDILGQLPEQMHDSGSLTWATGDVINKEGNVGRDSGL